MKFDNFMHCRYSVLENVIMDEITKATNEVQLYKSAGGGTMCEMSVVGMRRSNHSAADLKHISMATGVHIVAATGFYCDPFLPTWAKNMSVREMADFMLKEVGQGVDGSDGVKCGVMYIGCSNPLTEVEKRSLEAASITHKETGKLASVEHCQAEDCYSFPICFAGVSMTINPGKVQTSPFEILDLLSAHGIPQHAICMAHMDRTFTDSDSDLKKMIELCQRGCYIDHSLFGKECSHYQVRLDLDFPSDAQRIQRIKGLLVAGCLDRVLISHDIVCKHEWTCYGGGGYAHLLQHIAPKFMARGVDRETVDRIMAHNAKNWLTGSGS